jgi:hypothetical protein
MIELTKTTFFFPSATTTTMRDVGDLGVEVRKAEMKEMSIIESMKQK